MLKLNRFSLTWPDDWSLFVRLMDMYLAEVCNAAEAAQERSDLRDDALNAGLIRQSCRQRDPYFVMRITAGKDCIGLITYMLDEAQATGIIRNLYILPEHRRQGYGRAAVELALEHLRRAGAKAITLEPVPSALPFWLHVGCQFDGVRCHRNIPAYNGPAATQLLYYTRTPLDEDIYAPKLAHSVHLALIDPDGRCTPLMHNSGIVYARAVADDQGVLHAYSLKRPWITRLPGGNWAVVARRVEADGSADPASKDHVLFFTSPDLIHYTEQPLLHESDPLAQEYLAPRKAPDLAHITLPEGCIPCGLIDIPQDTARCLRTRFTTPVNVANVVPEQITAAQLPHVRALCRYSDGSTVEKRVDWRLNGLDLTRPGRYTITGRVHQDRFEFPFAWHKADPAICRWQGKYYFISTNDLDGNRTLFIREADTLPGLSTAQQVCILDADTYPHLGNLLWAPELHVIRNRLYIFHAGTPGPFVQEQSHVMALKEGGDPLKAADWEMSRRVIRNDGSMLYGSEGITLDQTVFWSGSRLYTVWSQRQFQPVDQGAWLFIAELDADKPWQLKTDPMVLTVPEYGWENNHTFVVEGPFALYRNGRILLTYSGALVDSTYVVGLMSIADGADPLVLANWTKENYPLLSSRSVPGEYGPGHNAYVTDEDGLVWNTYHARPGLQPTVQGSSSEPLPGSKPVFGARSSGIRRVHFNADGFPVLDMTEDMDLAPHLAWVSTTVVVD